jgi:hypothetical protein
MDRKMYTAVGVMLGVFILMVFLGLFESGCASKKNGNPTAPQPSPTAWSGSVMYEVDSFNQCQVNYTYLDNTGLPHYCTFTPDAFHTSQTITLSGFTCPFRCGITGTAGGTGCNPTYTAYAINQNSQYTFTIGQNGNWTVTGYRQVE